MQPLKDIIVLEMAGLAPAPFAGMILTDFGAKVIRVDKITSINTDVLSRNKRSVALNLKDPKAKQVFLKLCEKSDVLLDPFRPGVMESLGLGPQVVSKVNPKLIYARLTGYGQSGSTSAGHDINYLAMSGVLDYIRSTSKVFTKSMLADDGLEDHGKYVDRLVETVSANGEIDKILQGCYESYPLMRFHDVAMEKCCQMNEWLDFYDQLNIRINGHQEYSLYKYLPYPVVNFHRFFAGTTAQEHRVEYPRADYQLYSSRKTFENLIDMFLAGIKPEKRRFLNRDIISTELIPHLMYIISPDLKKVNKTLFTQEEKDTLAKLVHTMIDYGLTYVSQKTNEGQVLLKLEPPIEQVLYFGLSKPKSLLPRQHELRQLIASEIQQEIIITRERLAMTKQKKETLKKTVQVIAKPKILTKKVAVDYFNRPIIEEEPNTSRMEVDAIPQPVVRYIYHEGSSNAVKKPMKVKDFF
ncbi:hypothetical protein G6F56_004259 [Rhizopus delemar]|nr:hypothetical protein G6F56_004259 [Rhizopus delemar]